MKSIQNILMYTLGIATMVVVLMLTSYSEPHSPNQPNSPEADSPKTGAVQQINIPKIPDTISFAGEAIPIVDMDMRERFDRELLSICFGHSSYITSMKLANRYFPVMEKILKEQGVPDDFKYLAVTESNLRNAISHAGAKGIWQFMDATGKSYGLYISSEIDERYHIEKSTLAACKYLKNLHQKFGSWSLAAAAYNAGEGRVQERLREQKGASYYDIKLPEETMRYVPRIVAMKEVMSMPAKYGFNFTKEDLYPVFPKYRVIEVKNIVESWPDFAKEHGISYRTLQLHNPWILGLKLSVRTEKGFEVLIPE